MLIETKSWPYDFTKSEEFPASRQRGTITGQLLIQDRFVCALHLSANSWNHEMWFQFLTRRSVIQVREQEQRTGGLCVRGTGGTGQSRIMADRIQGRLRSPFASELFFTRETPCYFDVLFCNWNFQGYQFWTRADSFGNFTIENVRAGVYNLYAWVPGIVGDYKYEANITVTPSIYMLITKGLSSTCPEEKIDN